MAPDYLLEAVTKWERMLAFTFGTYMLHNGYGVHCTYIVGILGWGERSWLHSQNLTVMISLRLEQILSGQCSGSWVPWNPPLPGYTYMYIAHRLRSTDAAPFLATELRKMVLWLTLA